MRKPSKITLVVVAVMTLLPGCSNDPKEVKRNSYASKQDCQSDWGSDQCEEDKEHHGHYVSPYFFYRGGYPYMYNSDGVASKVPSSYGISRVSAVSSSPKAVASTTSANTVTRGGFGGTARGSVAS